MNENPLQVLKPTHGNLAWFPPGKRVSLRFVFFFGFGVFPGENVFLLNDLEMFDDLLVLVWRGWPSKIEVMATVGNLETFLFWDDI